MASTACLEKRSKVCFDLESIEPTFGYYTRTSGECIKMLFDHLSLKLIKN